MHGLLAAGNVHTFVVMLQCGGSNVLDDGALLGHSLLQVTLGTVQHTTSNTVSLCSSQEISGSLGSMLFTLDVKLVGVSLSKIKPGDSACYIANPHLNRLLAEILQIYPTLDAMYTKANLVEPNQYSPLHCCSVHQSLKDNWEWLLLARALTLKMTR